MMFLKTSIETLPSQNLENSEINPKTWYDKEKLFNNYDILYIVEKVLKNFLQ